MRKLSIFDDGVRIATITQIDSNILIFARSSREWSEMKRLTSYADSKDKDFLERLANKAHEFNYSTELLNE
jgi:hypothetical protein